MNIFTAGWAERYQAAVPLITSASVARTEKGGQILTVLQALQASGKAVMAWIPRVTPHNREKLWERVLADFIKVWSPELNEAVVGLGLYKNTWALLYGKAHAQSILAGGYDQPTSQAVRKKALRIELEALTSAAVVQEQFFQKNVLGRDLGASTPWFVTEYSNHKSVDFGDFM